MSRRLAQSVRAQIAWSQGHIADALAALERHLRAQLLEEVGRDEEALRWHNSFAEFSVYDVIYLAPSHLRRGEIYVVLQPSRIDCALQDHLAEVLSGVEVGMGLHRPIAIH